MEPVTSATPPLVPLPVAPEPKPRMLVRGVIAAIIVSGTVMGVYLALTHSYLPMLRVSSLAKTTLVSFTVPSGNTVYTLSAEGALSPYPLPEGTGTTSTLIAVAGDSHTIFYAVQNPKEGATIYARDTTAGSAPRVVVSSPTTKTELTYDAASHLLAYTATPLRTAPAKGVAPKLPQPSLTVFQLQTGKEISLGQGTHPLLFPGGAFLLAQVGAGITLLPIYGSTTPHTVLSNPSHAAFVLSSDGKMLALLNEKTNAIDFFSIATFGTASFLRSQSLKIPAASIGGSADSIYAVSNPVASSTAFSVENVLLGQVWKVSAPASRVFPTRIQQL